MTDDALFPARGLIREGIAVRADLIARLEAELGRHPRAAEIARMLHERGMLGGATLKAIEDAEAEHEARHDAEARRSDAAG